jgi:hypothetical protein
LRAHESILCDLLHELQEKGVRFILDAGSGRTSLSKIFDAFPDSDIDCVIYPGDERKKLSIHEYFPEKNYTLFELDLCKSNPEKRYDLAVAHLLLGEACKFDNSFTELLHALLSLKTKYVIRAC